MSFNCIETFDYSSDSQFTHRIQIIQQKDPSKAELYVNLRTFENGKPTENGICLIKTEFEKILPFLERRESTTIKNGRTLKFLKLDPNFFQLVLIKPNHDFQVMILTDTEITAIVALKDKLFKSCEQQNKV